MQKMVRKGCAVPYMVKSPNWHRRLQNLRQPVCWTRFLGFCTCPQEEGDKKPQSRNLPICWVYRIKTIRDSSCTALTHGWDKAQLSTATWHVDCHCDYARSSSQNWIVARALYLRSILSVSMNRCIYPSLNLRVHISSGPGQRRAFAILPRPET